MKKALISIVVISAIFLAACNSGKDKSAEDHDMSQMKGDTMQQGSMQSEKDIAVVTSTFTNVDANAAISVKKIVDHYLHLKNALINDNGSEAATASKEMEQVLTKVDKSLFTAEQKKVYDDIEDDLKEHTEHIGSNGNKIEHQREHFSMMSEDVYDLVKAFGGGQTLYHDHCPMANDSKGAMWLSEMKEVKNPYFGGKMNECVKVEEVIK